MKGMFVTYHDLHFKSSEVLTTVGLDDESSSWQIRDTDFKAVYLLKIFCIAVLK